MVTLVNRAKVATATTGTGTITLGSAESGYQTFADAGVVDADVVRYVIEDETDWEIGTGTYTASGTTLSRTVSESSNAGAAINLTGSAVVYVTAAGEDIQQPPSEGSFVDGDKTKLDGIETLADVTDTANVTAAGALMDSEVTNLASVKSFDPTDYATAAQGSTADTALQSGDNISELTNDAGYTTNTGDITGVTAGAGITGGGTSGTVTISHADTSAQGSVNNSGRTYIQDVTLDAYGHVTGLVSATETVMNTTSLPIENSAGTAQFTATDATGLQFTASGASSVAFDAVNQRVTISSTDTNTTYSAGAGLGLTGNTFSVDSTVATLTGSQNLTNKTLTSPAFTGSITEETGAMPAGTTPALDPVNGTVQQWTLTGNSSPTDSLADGEFVELMIQDGTAYTITWPTITWLTDSAVAPTLSLTTVTPVLIQKVGSTLYGRRTGDGG